jgi:hypothetical protein
MGFMSKIKKRVAEVTLTLRFYLINNYRYSSEKATKVP